MKLQPRMSAAKFSTNLWMIHLVSSTRLSRRSSDEPPPNVMRARHQPVAARAKAADAPQPSPARVKAIFVPSAAWQQVDRKAKRAIVRIAVRWAPAVALRIAELSLAMTMTSLPDDCGARRNRRPTPSSRKSSGRNTRITSVIPRVANAGRERS